MKILNTLDPSINSCVLCVITILPNKYCIDNKQNCVLCVIHHHLCLTLSVEKPFWLETAAEFCPGRVQGSSGRALEMKRQKCGEEEAAIRRLVPKWPTIPDLLTPAWFLKTWQRLGFSVILSYCVTFGHLISLSVCVFFFNSCIN